MKMNREKRYSHRHADVANKILRTDPQLSKPKMTVVLWQTILETCNTSQFAWHKPIDGKRMTIMYQMGTGALH